MPLSPRNLSTLKAETFSVMGSFTKHSQLDVLDFTAALIRS